MAEEERIIEPFVIQVKKNLIKFYETFAAKKDRGKNIFPFKRWNQQEFFLKWVMNMYKYEEQIYYLYLSFDAHSNENVIDYEWREGNELKVIFNLHDVYMGTLVSKTFSFNYRILKKY